MQKRSGSEDQGSKRKFSLENYNRILKSLQLILYLGFLLAWFKGNFPAWDFISLSPWPFLFILLAVTLSRIGIRLRQGRTLRVRFSKEIALVLILLFVAILVRIPFLAHSYGLINSDDGISALQAKHISEGNARPIYYYGQHYMGSLPFHIYALVFKIFGYSIFLYVFVYFLFYLAFMVIQYLLFREIFSSQNLALLLTSFYALPLGHLLSMSFYVGANFTIVFFLGSLFIYLAYLAYTKQIDAYIPGIGFLMGLAFWTHPISIAFITCAALFLVLRIRFYFKKYFILTAYFLIGVFPVVLYELGTNFKSFQHAFSPNQVKVLFWGKMAKIIGNLPVLISMENNFLNGIYLSILLLGIISVVAVSVWKRRFLPENIFVIFFLTFLLIYTFSRFPADETKLRYLYPFYFCLPVLLAGPFIFLKSKVKFLMVPVLFLTIFVVSNARDVGNSLRLTWQADATLKRVVQTMESTGEKYWAATFWEAVLITAISGERLECTSCLHFSEGRYVPWRYRLSFFNQSLHTNYFFLKEAGGFAVRFKEIMPLVQDNFVRMYQQKDHLLALMHKLQIDASVIQDEKFTLIYKSEVPLLPEAIKSPIPSNIPELIRAELSCERGFLKLGFKINNPPLDKGFRIYAEIPGFSKVHRGLALNPSNPSIRIPFPEASSFRVDYGLIYCGIKIPSSRKTLVYRPKPSDLLQSKKRIVYLSGVGPEVRAFEKDMRACEKSARLLITPTSQAANRIQISLYSPFDFNNPFWYGRYNQQVRIEIDSEFVTEQRLDYGENLLEIDLPPLPLNERSCIIELKFRYHTPCYTRRLWCTAAYLDYVKLEK
ncbi:MAG: hypothetical protein GQ544_07430 [Candidatus Aminicenantes bacterium]|nr:hypothetical protein [Candidatus Aminicenantes bacterium]